MCLGIPLKIVRIDGYLARCEAKGVARDVSLVLLQGESLASGDFVLAHLGSAIQTMSEAEARLAWEVYDEILAAEDCAPGA